MRCSRDSVGFERQGLGFEGSWLRFFVSGFEVSRLGLGVMVLKLKRHMGVSEK